ncbi:MAG TPA: hypothetical protein VLE70_04840 [Anaerolineae bacterium]|jgi:hypothetical protein|nr:hypothetical protein [Anaerolineae bacterium]
MEIDIKKQDEVWTSDEKKLGAALQLFHRTDEVNPSLQLYASYLEVENFEYGETFYVPTDFIVERQGETGRLTLSKKQSEAMQLTWFRMPEFVVHGRYRKEGLPE